MAEDQNQAGANPVPNVPLTSVKNAIVHTMVAEKGKVWVDPRKEALEIGPLAQRLVDTLYGVYRRRPSKSHGKFNGDEEAAPAQKHARAYLLEAAEKDFCAFTERMANLLCDKAQNTGATTGHVFFAHIEGDGREYLLIAIVTNEIDLALSKAKELEETEHLDLKDFRFAGRIDVSAWRDDQDRYVSFLKGTKDVSSYFMAFLGCDTAIPNLADTQHLTNTLCEFAQSATCKGEPLSEEQQNEWLWRVDAHCQEMIRKGEPLMIEAFCNELWPEDPKALSDALLESDYPISDGFVLNRRGLKELVHFRGKAKHWELKFDREALSEKDVRYNPDDGTITLYNVPDDLAERLKAQTEKKDE